MPLPTFIIGGERRGGTTSLYHWMKAHPDVYLYPKADMDYFIEAEIQDVRKWRDGESNAAQWERTHSIEEYARLFESATGTHAIGQKDADLLFWHPAHERLARFLPNCRFILVLRHPVQRAWSHYWNEVAKGREWLPFSEAIAAESERCRSSAYARMHLSYVRRGFYDESLSAFLKCISRDHVLIATQEDCRRAPEENLQRIYDFIGVDKTRGLELAGQVFNENTASIPREWTRAGAGKDLAAVWGRVTEAVIRRGTSNVEQRRRWRRTMQMPFRQTSKRIPIDPDSRRRLLDIYLPHTEALERVLGWELPEWKQ